MRRRVLLLQLQAYQGSAVLALLRLWQIRAEEIRQCPCPH